MAPLSILTFDNFNKKCFIFLQILSDIETAAMTFLYSNTIFFHNWPYTYEFM